MADLDHIVPGYCTNIRCPRIQYREQCVHYNPGADYRCDYCDCHKSQHSVLALIQANGTIVPLPGVAAQPPALLPAATTVTPGTAPTTQTVDAPAHPRTSYATTRDERHGSFAGRSLQRSAGSGGVGGAPSSSGSVQTAAGIGQAHNLIHKAFTFVQGTPIEQMTLPASTATVGNKMAEKKSASQSGRSAAASAKKKLNTVGTLVFCQRGHDELARNAAKVIDLAAKKGTDRVVTGIDISDREQVELALMQSVVGYDYEVTGWYFLYLPKAKGLRATSFTSAEYPSAEAVDQLLKLHSHINRTVVITTTCLESERGDFGLPAATSDDEQRDGSDGSEQENDDKAQSPHREDAPDTGSKTTSSGSPEYVGIHRASSTVGEQASVPSAARQAVAPPHTRSHLAVGGGADAAHHSKKRAARMLDDSPAFVVPDLILPHVLEGVPIYLDGHPKYKRTKHGDTQEASGAGSKYRAGGVRTAEMDEPYSEVPGAQYGISGPFAHSTTHADAAVPLSGLWTAAPSGGNVHSSSAESRAPSNWRQVVDFGDADNDGVDDADAAEYPAQGEASASKGYPYGSSSSSYPGPQQQSSTTRMSALEMLLSGSFDVPFKPAPAARSSESRNRQRDEHGGNRDNLRPTAVASAAQTQPQRAVGNATECLAETTARMAAHDLPLQGPAGRKSTATRRDDSSEASSTESVVGAGVGMAIAPASESARRDGDGGSATPSTSVLLMGSGSTAVYVTVPAPPTKAPHRQHPSPTAPSTSTIPTATNRQPVGLSSQGMSTRASVGVHKPKIWRDDVEEDVQQLPAAKRSKK